MTKTIAVVFAASLCACAHSKTPSSSASTSAHPAGAGSPSVRTVDNTGYVDPGGRTRQVSQGVGPAPYGRGNEIAPIRPESPSERENSERSSTTTTSSATWPTPPSGDRIELIDRAARALCDRETYCGRVGDQKQYGSAEACMAAKRDRIRAQVDDITCGDVPGDRVAFCLNAIRHANCGTINERVEPPRECEKQVLCNAP